jgi:hypothetical protein
LSFAATPELDFAPRYCLDAVNDHFTAPRIA